MVRTIWLTVCAAFLLCAGTVPTALAGWAYTGQLHRAVASADRIVVRHGGQACCGPVEDDPVLFIVTNRAAISGVLARLSFQMDQESGNACMCCGYPGMDWYKGTNRLALTSIQHGRAIRWEGLAGDTALTPGSARWLADWMAEHGVTRPQEDVAGYERNSQLWQEGMSILQQVAGDVVYHTLETIERTQGPAALSPRELLRSRYANDSAFRDGLFELLGALPRWWVGTSTYYPERICRRILDEMALEELDKALQAASVSTNNRVRRGATRYVFETRLQGPGLFGDESGFLALGDGRKVDEDTLTRWVGWVVDDAMADPFPANRSEVFQHLERLGNERAAWCLEQFLVDPDPDIRKRAQDLLKQSRTDEARMVRERNRYGPVLPSRPVVDLPKDYSKGEKW